MTSKYDDLIERLRGHDEYVALGYDAWTAADAIKELVAERERKLLTIEAWEQVHGDAMKRAEKAEAERDELGIRLSKEIEFGLTMTAECDELRKEVEQLHTAIKRQAGAAKTLRESTLAEVRHLKDKDRSEYHAAATLDSEREANARLTEELEKAQAERDSLSVANHRQANCIHQCASHIGPDTSATIEGLSKAVKRVVSERDELKLAIEKANGIIRAQTYDYERAIDERDQAQALAAAIEQKTIARCVSYLDHLGQPYAARCVKSDVMPCVEYQSALDRIVDERTKELREAAWEMLEAFCVHEDSGQMAAADRLEEVLSRTSGKDQ